MLHENISAKVHSAKEKALAGQPFDRETIISLLSIPENSRECDQLGDAAREVAEKVSGNRAYLWGAVGVDTTPCEMNCRYCSLGAQWGIMTKEHSLSENEIIDHVRSYADANVRWIVLRTTQFYEAAALQGLIERIRAAVPGDYEIGLNTGELNVDEATRISNAGATFAYHSLRLGEGRDTSFNPQDRINTLHSISRSPLDLVYLIEPVGEEHTNEELADIMMSVLDCHTNVSGAMARIPVPGTPLGNIPQISERRLAKITAVSRLAFNYAVPDICVHPYSDLAFSWGANVTVIERGVIPRDSKCSEKYWNDFGTSDAISAFERNGYTVHNKAENQPNLNFA